MQLLNKNNLTFELKPENNDDLWILSEFINPEDIIYATTERKVKIGDENSSKQVKKLMYIELLAKKINFENNILRISGEIQNETEYTAIGQNHSISIKANDKIIIKKNNILKFEEKILNKSLETKKSHNLLILIDRDEIVGAEFTSFSYKIILTANGLGSKKQYNQEIDENKQKYELIKDLLNKDYNNIIFSGPGDFKERLAKYIKDFMNIKISIITFPEVNASSAVQKAIKIISEKNILEDSRLAEEEEETSELLKNININNKYAYGYENSKNATNEGKVEKLLITTKLITKYKDEGNYSEINSIMKTCEDLNGKLFILDSKNEPGRIIDGLGGIACICRY